MFSSSRFVVNSNSLFLGGTDERAVSVIDTVTDLNTPKYPTDNWKIVAAAIGTISSNTTAIGAAFPVGTRVYRGLEISGTVIEGRDLDKLSDELFNSRLLVNCDGYQVEYNQQANGFEFVIGNCNLAKLNNLFGWGRYGVKPAMTTVWNRDVVVGREVVVDYVAAEEARREMDAELRKQRTEVREWKLRMVEKDEILRHYKRVLEENKEVMKEKESGKELLTEMIEEKNGVVEEQSRVIKEKEAGIQSLKSMMAEKESGKELLREMIEEKNRAVEEQSRVIKEKEAEIQSFKSMVEEKELLREMTEEKSRVVEEQSRVIKEKEMEIQSLKLMMLEKEKKVEEDNRTEDGSGNKEKVVGDDELKAAMDSFLSCCGKDLKGAIVATSRAFYVNVVLVLLLVCLCLSSLFG